MDKIVAVTGAEGFIGSHLVEELVGRGFRVRAMVQYNSFASWGWLDTLPADVMDQVEVVLGDVRDPGSVLQLVRGAETVYHLAALIAIPYSYTAPRSYVDTNVIGTLHVLEAVRAEQTPRLVHTSTSETYGTAQSVPITETHPENTQSPYAASKLGGDKLVQSYHDSFATPAVILRPFNTYGPRQSARAVIPTIIAQLAAGHTTLALGALSPTRDFLYVKDTASAFATVGTAPAEHVIGELFNAGTGEEISIAGTATLIAELMNRPATFTSETERLRPPNSEVQRLVCDSTKLQKATDWRPSHSLQDGLGHTIDWFTQPANLARYKPAIYNV
jgi:NAD dependent epimerase/dehydratase